MASSSEPLRYIDIGVNLGDPIFHGLYRGKQVHQDDLASVLSRADIAGVKGMLLTGGSLHESREVLDLAKDLGAGVYCTAGVHPTRTSQLDSYRAGPDAYLELLEELVEANSKPKVKDGKIVAWGECGLDYDRLHFSDADTQRRHFAAQLKLAQKHGLPLFLHSRAAHADFVQICKDSGYGQDGGRQVGGRGGVVHSFTGTIEEMNELVEMGFYIGLNGCSLKTAENLEVAKAVPLDKLMLETDAPWCSITTAHASHTYLESLDYNLRSLYFPPSFKKEKFILGQPVKGRNEPCAVGGVAWIVSRVKEVPLEEVARKAWENTVELFDLAELRSGS